MKYYSLFAVCLLLYLSSFSRSFPKNDHPAWSDSDTLLLQVSRVITRPIRAGEIQYCKIRCNTGEFVRGHVDGAIRFKIKALFPDGSRIRSFGPPASGRKNFRFVAEVPGDYLVEITSMDTGRYQAMLEQVQPIEDRLKIARDEKYSSPRIAALRKEMEAGNKEALEKFWAEVKQHGTPLAEPFSEKYSLITFLWRETFKIYNVVVMWTPYTQEHPEDYKMKPIPGTDVWYKTLRVPKNARFFYQLSPNETLSRAANAQRFATAQRDPLNPQRWPGDLNLTRYEVLSIVSLPDAPPQPYSSAIPGVPNGKIEKLTFKSTILDNERTLSIYTPSGYKKGTDHNLLILFDEDTYLTSVPAPVILDNLIAQKKIPPTVAILINYPGNTRDQELSCNPQFANMLEKELLPWVHDRYPVTKDPAKTIVGGLSNGGLAAAYVALRSPGCYGKVLAQSGAFWYAPGRNEGEAPNWIARQYVDSPKLPLTFYLEAGLFENDIRGEGGQILETSRHFRDVLKAKGYEVFYQEFAGGHDYLTWRGTLADGLLFLAGTEK